MADVPRWFRNWEIKSSRDLTKSMIYMYVCKWFKSRQFLYTYTHNAHVGTLCTHICIPPINETEKSNNISKKFHQKNFTNN